MASYRFEFTSTANADLDAIDFAVSQRILRKLRWLIEQDSPLHFAKKLKGDFEDSYRFRVGDYRVLFRVNEKGVIIVLVIIHIGHRKDIYE